MVSWVRCYLIVLIPDLYLLTYFYSQKEEWDQWLLTDYRKLNQHTEKDTYSIPYIDDTLHSVAGSRYLTALDLESDFWQVELKGTDNAKTEVQVGSLGFYVCIRMLFGLCNAPATFQRLMERCMGDLNLRKCHIYLDNIIVFSTNF